MEGVKLLVPVGGSRGNILQSCKLDGVAEIHLLLTRSLFPTEESAKKMQNSLINLGIKTPVTYDFIDGPEAGPVGCRDSINEWKEVNVDYVPDQIFVTASTNLIVASISCLFPSADLISLRGEEVLRLPEQQVVANLDSLKLEEYLALHGMKLNKKGKLTLDGHNLSAPPLDNCVMTKKKKVALTWRWSKETKSTKQKREQKKGAQLVGQSIKEIIESVGIGAFDFNAYGFGNYMSNSSDPKIVNTTEEEEE